MGDKFNQISIKLMDKSLHSVMKLGMPKKSRHQNLSSFISSFSIPLLSHVKAKKLSLLFDNDSKSLLEFIKNLDFELVENELGKKTREALDLFFSDELNLENFEKTIVEMIF
jgi:hypothetical protein